PPCSNRPRIAAINGPTAPAAQLCQFHTTVTLPVTLPPECPAGCPKSSRFRRGLTHDSGVGGRGGMAARTLLRDRRLFVSSVLRGSALIALVISSVAALAPATLAAEPAIVVEGNRQIDAAAIRAHFHAAPGGALDAAALDAALKELYASG